LIFDSYKGFYGEECQRYYKTYHRFTVAQLLKKISDIFILRIETWGTSSSFFEKYLKEKKNKLINEKIWKYIPKIPSLQLLQAKPGTIDFNLFDEVTFE